MVASALSGQTALIALPTKHHDIDSFEIPIQLKVTNKVVKKKGTSSGSPGKGMEVIKVANNGKRQIRQVAISGDGRVLLISSEKVSMRNLMRKKNLDSFKKIYISSIDRIVRGQITRIHSSKTKTGGPVSNILVEEEHISLSVVFRINSASTNLMAEQEELTITTDSTNSWGTLDLIIPSQSDYELFIATIESLMNRNRLYKMGIHRDILLLQYHWMDMGKSLRDRINQSEWASLCCDRLSVPTRRSTVSSLFKKIASVTKSNHEGGVSLPNAVEILQQTRKLTLHVENKVDPCDVIWNILLQHNIKYEKMPVYDSESSDQSTISVKGNKKFSSLEQETVTAAAFLKFLQLQQKNSSASIQQVKDLFGRLNSIATASQITDDGITKKRQSIEKPFSRELISKEAFFNYILSDSNDAFDPSRGEWEQDDMTQPLCSYWINASHDTYLKETPPTINNNEFKMDFMDCPVNVNMYATALYRGCRCLDIDIWDGTLAQEGQPVIKFDSSSKSSAHPGVSESHGSLNKTGEQVLFSDVLWLVRSFLLSNPRTLPVILFIESHCSLSNQKKMAVDISNILGCDDMVYIPKGQEGEILPSPDEMRGKAVVKFKIADRSKSAAFDDYDEDNDVNYNDDVLIISDDEESHSFGIDTIHSILSDTQFDDEKSTGELEIEAETEMQRARNNSKKADEEAFEAKLKADRAKEIASQLLKKANMTSNDAEKQLNEAEAEVSERAVEVPMNPERRKTPNQSQNVSLWNKLFFGIGDNVAGNMDTRENSLMKTNPSNHLNSMLKEDGSMRRILKWGDSEYSASSDSSCDYTFEVDSDAGSKRNDQYHDETERDASTPKRSHRNDITVAHSDDSGSSSYTENDDIDSIEDSEVKESIKETREIGSKDIKELEEKINGFNQYRENNGVEVEHFFSGAGIIDHDLKGYNEAEKRNQMANEIYLLSTEFLEISQREFSEANEDLITAKQEAKARREVALHEKELVEKDIISKRERDFTQQSAKTLKAQEKFDERQVILQQAEQDASCKNATANQYYEEVNTLKELLNHLSNKLSSSRNIAETAATEDQVSLERAADAERRLVGARKILQLKIAVAEEQTKGQEETEKTVATERKVSFEVTKNYNAAKQKWQVIVDALERVNREIKGIESSSAFQKEQRQAEEYVTDSGPLRKKLKMKANEKYGLEDRLTKALRGKRIAGEKKKEADKYLAAAVSVCNTQSQKAARAREEADNVMYGIERISEELEEEREAAKMRKIAAQKSLMAAADYEVELSKTRVSLGSAETQWKYAREEAIQSQSKLDSVRRNSEEIIRNHQINQEAQKRVERLMKEKIIVDIYVPGEFEGLDDLLERAEKKRKQLRSAEKAHKKADEAHQWSKNVLEEAQNIITKNADIYYKARIDATLKESQQDIQQKRVENALAAYQHHKKLLNEATKAKEKAAKHRAYAAEKAGAYRRAQDYTKKKAFIHPISMELSQMTLLHSVKFKYFEQSKVLPFNHMHSLSEGKIYQIYANGNNEKNDLMKFNKTHLTRVFPSKHQAMRRQSNNFNPVLAWSLGCQFACMNQQFCDAFILVNDGRFRVNGSCGYVLKPEAMIERKGGETQRRLAVKLPRRWSIKILSGYNLPKPRKKALSGYINPRVRLTLYDSGHNVPPVVHMTETLKKNGLNPIWDETKGCNFKVRDPSTAVILFSLWDADEGKEDFIAAAAIPISCMRQGYRSIPLFDANHMRCGSHGSTMLLARIDAR